MAITSIALTPTTVALVPGQTQQFSAVATNDDTTTTNVTNTATWASNSAHVTINSTGLATAVSAGTANITATSTVASSPAVVTVTTPPAVDSVLLTGKNFRCVEAMDQYGQPVYTSVSMRLFYANCPKINQLCSKNSSAYVPAVTVCNQRLFS